MATKRKKAKRATKAKARKSTKSRARKPAKRKSRAPKAAAGGKITGEIKKNKKGKYCVITRGNKPAFKGDAGVRMYGCHNDKAAAQAKLNKVT